LPHDNDEIAWLHDSEWPLTVKSFWTMQFGALSGLYFLSKSIWKFSAPAKAYFFAWVATKGKIATEQECLKKKFWRFK